VIIVTGCDYSVKFRGCATVYPDDYEQLKAVPWLVLTGGDGKAVYQCILGRSDYPCLEELRNKLKNMGVREFATPWYYKLYRWLKKISRQ